jgi:hypothetical protein
VCTHSILLCNVKSPLNMSDLNETDKWLDNFLSVSQTRFMKMHPQVLEFNVYRQTALHRVANAVETGVTSGNMVLYQFKETSVLRLQGAFAVVNSVWPETKPMT